MSIPPATLQQRWLEFRAQNPKVRIRDAAASLGVSEAELVALGCSPDRGQNIRLQPEWGRILQGLPNVGRTMALTRNEAAVHERKGRYEKVEIFDGHHQMGQVLGPDIDLRLFLSHWRFGYAVAEPTGTDMRRSLQFFDKHGEAIHKVYLQSDGGNLDAWTALIADFRETNQGTGESPETRPDPAPPVPVPAVDHDRFLADWDAMQDTHEFFGLLRKYRLQRTDALRVAGPPRAHKIGNDAARRLLNHAATVEVPIMVFVGNQGCIQIHTGTIHNIRIVEDWVNVLDSEFNLHLREDLIRESWIVRKPTRDGAVTSLELYDPQGENIALFFGKRKPGNQEASEWRELVTRLESGE
jgi:putative hemin transport protein